jgi:hypothetical protein
MNRTRVENVRKQTQFAFAIGHGSLITNNSRASNLGKHQFTVPSGIHVVFFSNPGYWISLRVLNDPNLLKILDNPQQFKKFIDGELPRDEIPKIVKESNWNWKQHIYGPGMLCPNMYLQMYDEENTSWGRWYNNMCGFYYFDTIFNQQRTIVKSSAKKYTSAENLVTNLKQTPFKGVLFLFGCRGDPAVPESIMKRRFNASGKFGQPQTYLLPPSRIVPELTEYERYAARYMGKKRIINRPHPGSRKSKTLVNRSSSLNNTQNNLPTLNFPVRTLNKYTKMVRRIQEPTFGVRGDKQLQIQAARKYFPTFFHRNMTNENVRLWINSIKRSNANLTNRMSTLWNSETINQNWKNNRNVARRLLYRIKNLER